MRAAYAELESLIQGLANYRLHATQSAQMFDLAMKAYEQSFSCREEFCTAALKAVEDICKVMPPYAPLVNSINRFCLLLEGKEEAIRPVCEAWSREDRAERMRSIACRLIAGRKNVCTFTFSQTVSSCLSRCKALGLDFSVIVTESGPNKDGLDTVRLLSKQGIPCRATLDADMRKAADEADIALFGCEAVLPNGSVIGKVGQSTMAYWCHRRSVPVYIYAGCEKLLPGPLQCVSNLIREVSIPAGSISARYFDVTPARYISGVITENGIISPEASSHFTSKRVSGYLLSCISR